MHKTIELFANTEPQMLALALVAGIAPAIVWLFFWLREDRLHPEPRSLITLSFLVGMLATSIAYPAEHWFANFIVKKFTFVDEYTLLFFWSAIEETLKYVGIGIIALRTQFFDEPIDAVIYFVTIALGFAALENAMFLLNPVSQGDFWGALLLGNFRFIGSTVLHVAASAIVGIALAFSFYERKLERALAGATGLAGAITLHALFNFSIMASEGRQEVIMGVFIVLWSVIILILFLCEYAKLLSPRSHVEHPHTGMTRYIPQ
jgi:RsiW-degrading membrane proteinase PrsW (M82 family)